MTQGFRGFLLLLGGGGGCGEGAGCRAGGGPGFKICPFLSVNHNGNQNIKLSKNQGTLSFCKKSLWSSWPTSSDK